MDIMMPIINKQSNISLRIIDWFIINYSKNKKITYYLHSQNGVVVNYSEDGRSLAPSEGSRSLAPSEGGCSPFFVAETQWTVEPFSVYKEYKLKLKSFKKKKFDIFCRHERTLIPCNDESQPDMFIESTVAQLNCFKWVIEKKILDYITDHFDVILSDMNTANNISKKLKLMGGNMDKRTRKQKKAIITPSLIEARCPMSVFSDTNLCSVSFYENSDEDDEDDDSSIELMVDEFCQENLKEPPSFSLPSSREQSLCEQSIIQV
jgi:hypothetical protein